MTRRRPYPSDLTDAHWELIGPTLTAWRAERRGKGLDIGRPPEHDLRRVMDAVLYVDRTGISWRYLPRDFAPWETVYGYFAAWPKEGVFDQLNGLLRRLVRAALRREAGRGDRRRDRGRVARGRRLPPKDVADLIREAVRATS